MRVYAMWNQSKGILYSLLFVYIPQVILSFVFQGIYHNPNTYFSGMSPTKLQAKVESHVSWCPLVSHQPFLQSQLSKLLISHSAVVHSAMPHPIYCWVW